jgi:serine/threonine-protein kinase
VQALLGERYRLIRKVGHGSAGQVFQAVDTVLERLVAVKFLLQKTPSAKSSAENWREARLMSQLNHPNIAQIYEVGELDSQRFIVMEWVDGLPISDAWKGLQLEQRLRMYLGVLDAVGAAHRRGIIHRDLKPSNILISSELKPKVLDFGIAMETSALENLETAVYRGTPAYSAPEQITRPVKISPATDVFALGVLLYQLLTDVLPFPQTKVDELFEAVKSKYPELPTAVAERIPIPLQNICLKALEKEPDKRYLSAQALCDDINRYLRGEKVWSTPSFLADKIQQEVFYHRQKLKVWRNNQLLTEREHDKLERIYERMVAPADPSIIEARELSLSQVCLYLGGWISVLGSFVLFYATWNKIPVSFRPVPAIAATVFMIVLGMRMWRKQDSRLAVGFLATSSLLVFLSALLMLGQWKVLNPESFPLGKESPSTLGENLVVGNAQMFMACSLWLGFSILFLRTTRSSIFVVSSTVAFLALLTVCYIIAGMEDWEEDIVAGRYLYPGLGLFGLGIFVDRRRLAQHAIPLSVIGLILIVASLSLIARSDSTLFGWVWPQSDSEEHVSHVIEKGKETSEQSGPFLKRSEKVGLSFVINGLFYLGLASLCQRMGTALQRRLAQILNWLGALHILGALRILDLDKIFGDPNHITKEHRDVYRTLLPIASVIFVFASVARQMKSFFFSGLAGIATTIHKFTIEIPRLKEFFVWPVGLILVGVVWMLVSMLVPRWQANRRLRPKK